MCISLLAIFSSDILSYGGVDNVFPPPSWETLEFDLLALYVFGDSYVVSGNNNFIPTKSRTKYFPYGIDFGGVHIILSLRHAKHWKREWKASSLGCII